MTLPARAARSAAARVPKRLAVLLREVRERGLEQLRIGWCDMHGVLRGKTLVVGPDDASLAAVGRTLAAGVGMVSTLLLKDSSDRTVYAVFDPAAREALAALTGLGQADNVLLHVDPASLHTLPWAPDTGWLRAQAGAEDGTPLALDTRHVLQRALAQLAATGHTLTVGLEVEFHIHRITDDGLASDAAAWPAEPPALRHTHPGYQLLSEAWADLADEPLAIVRRTALGLGLPLRSLEIELGPSQVEAVFGPTDALAAADGLVLFRSAVRQALRRAGYHASFVCRPPFLNSVASGWHLHQSLRRVEGGPAFMRGTPPAGTDRADARRVLSDIGVHWLAGLREHARGMAALCAPTLSGYSRLQGSVMAPQSAVWGFDNRGAMLRVVGAAGDPATRIENRIAEPMANPYLALAAQVFAGLDGLQRRLEPGPATESPYAADPAARLPTTLAEALHALAADTVLTQGLGAPLAQVFQTAKRQEIQRFEAASDPDEWLRREYFSRA